HLPMPDLPPPRLPAVWRGGARLALPHVRCAGLSEPMGERFAAPDGPGQSSASPAGSGQLLDVSCAPAPPTHAPTNVCASGGADPATRGRPGSRMAESAAG